MMEHVGRVALDRAETPVESAFRADAAVRFDRTGRGFTRLPCRESSSELGIRTGRRRRLSPRPGVSRWRGTLQGDTGSGGRIESRSARATGPATRYSARGACCKTAPGASGRHFPRPCNDPQTLARQGV